MKQTIQLQIEGTLAESAHLEKALEAVPGIEDVRVEIELDRATIEHEGSNREELLRAIKATGHKATLLPADAAALAPPLPRMNSTTDDSRRGSAS
ncbi:hypothetical protein BH18VER1_BH18VER1_07240 [soil metagenome]